MSRRRLEKDDSFLKLVAYVDAHRKPGTLLTYDGVEEETGVLMDRGGRDKLREAILYSGLEYRLIRGEAFELAQVGTCREILGNKLMSIDSRIKRAEQARKRVAWQFFKALPKEEQDRLLFLQAVFGAIQGKADEARKGLYGKKTPALSPGQSIPPILPNV